MFEYLWIGMKTLWKNPVFSFTIYLLAAILLLILWRRFIIVRRSGGNFFSPFHIAKGRIDVKCVQSIKLNGARYHVCIEQKDRKPLSFFCGKSKQNDLLVKNLKNETKNYHIRIVIDG